MDSLTGASSLARQIAIAHYLGEVPDGWERVGRGSHRTVYLAPDRRTVYKVGLDGVNRQEARGNWATQTSHGCV